MNLANKLTLLRICFVPVFVALMLIPFTGHRLAAGVVFILAALTDILDGQIARKRGEITRLGVFIDPLADKMLVLSAMVVLVEFNEIPSWAVLVVLFRELAVTGFRVLAAANRIMIAASVGGKTKTVMQIVALALLIFDNFPFRYIHFPLDQIAFYLSVGATVLSGADYLWKNRNVLYAKEETH